MRPYPRARAIAPPQGPLPPPRNGGNSRRSHPPVSRAGLRARREARRAAGVGVLLLVSLVSCSNGPSDAEIAAHNRAELARYRGEMAQRKTDRRTERRVLRYLRSNYASPGFEPTWLQPLTGVRASSGTVELDTELYPKAANDDSATRLCRAVVNGVVLDGLRGVEQVYVNSSAGSLLKRCAP